MMAAYGSLRIDAAMQQGGLDVGPEAPPSWGGRDEISKTLCCLFIGDVARIQRLQQ